MNFLVDPSEIDLEEDSSTELIMHVKDKLRLFDKFLKRYLPKDEEVSEVSSISGKLIKLPRLQLHPFDGHPENWSTFWNSFECAVHNNDDISDVQKMTYLKNLVDGPTASCIAGFRPSNENYETSIELLKERYNNKQLFISSHMKNLLKLDQEEIATSGVFPRNIIILF